MCAEVATENTYLLAGCLITVAPRQLVRVNGWNQTCKSPQLCSLSASFTLVVVGVLMYALCNLELINITHSDIRQRVFARK